MKRLVFLLSELVRRDLTVRYAGSFGGFAWAILNPLVFCFLYGFVFAVVLRVGPPAGFPGGYVDFLLGGMLPWLGVQDAVMRGSGSITDQGHLVKKLPFPPELLVVSSVAAALVLEAAAISVLAAFVVGVRGLVPSPTLLAAAFLLQVALLAGPVLALAALHVFFRDLSQILAPLLMIVFYMSPILYPASMVPASLAGYLSFNPVSDLVGLFRAALFGVPPPPAPRLALWLAGSGVLAWVGLVFFRRCRRTFSDIL